MATNARPETEPRPASAEPRKNMLLVVATVAVVLAVVAVSGAAWFVMVRGHATARANESPRTPAHVWKAGTIVVNVAGTEGRRYLRTTVELGTTQQDSKHLEELRAPLVDTAIHVLGGKRLEQLFDPAERDKLKEELRTQFNATIGGESITHVFLTEFVVQ